MFLLLLAANVQAAAADALPSPSELAAAAARRFPQQVQVGTLLNRDVLQPAVNQAVLGTVRQVVRQGAAAPFIIIDAGGHFGFGTHPVAVPADALALLGADMVLVGYTPAQFQALPAFTGPSTPLPSDATIPIGVTKPSH